jgi:hypothetical protein
MMSASAVVSLAAMLFQAGAPPAAKAPHPDHPILDNARATVWDTAAPRIYTHEFVAIELADGSVWSGRAGTAPTARGRTIVVELKDASIPPMANTSGYPNAFPRPGSKKVLESTRVIVWDYTWAPGVPTPMHFHDKDVVVVYLKDGALKSTAPSGQSVVNQYTFGQTKFNARNRAHTETLVKGSQRAIIVEFK